MRLIHFLNEDSRLGSLISDTIEIKDTKKKIHKECKPWLTASKGYTIWRGMKAPSYGGKFTVRKARKPLDTPLDVHKEFDKIFKKHFGWKSRSEGLLTTGDKKVAGSYGTPYKIFPIGKFRFVWSENVHDLYGRYVEFMGKQGIIYSGGGDWKKEFKVQSGQRLIIKSDDLYLSKKELAVYQDRVFKQLDDLIKKEYSDKNIIQASTKSK